MRKISVFVYLMKTGIPITLAFDWIALSIISCFMVLLKWKPLSPNRKSA